MELHSFSADLYAGDQKTSDGTATICLSSVGLLGNPRGDSLEVVGNPEIALPTARLPMAEPDHPAAPAAKVFMRRFCITRRFVKKFGATVGCRGCSKVGNLHLEACREPTDAWRLREYEYKRGLDLGERGGGESPKRHAEQQAHDARSVRPRSVEAGSSIGAPAEPASEEQEPGGDDVVMDGADADMGVEAQGSGGDDRADTLMAGLAECHVDDTESGAKQLLDEYDGMEFFDEMTGTMLHTHAVVEARAAELRCSPEFDVYEEVDEREALFVTNKKPISSR